MLFKPVLSTPARSARFLDFKASKSLRPAEILTMFFRYFGVVGPDSTLGAPYFEIKPLSYVLILHCRGLFTYAASTVTRCLTVSIIPRTAGESSNTLER